VNQELIQVVEKLKKPTLFFGVELKKDESPNLKSHMGGKPYMSKGEKYPVCTRCKEKMNFIFQLFIPRKDETIHDLYVFYYCCSCHPYQGAEGFAIKKYSEPNMEEMKESRVLDYIPYAEFYFEPTWSLPDWGTLGDRNPEIMKMIQRENKEEPWEMYEEIKSTLLGVDGYESLCFYGGHPQFMKEPKFPVCSCCKKPMKLWVQLDSSEELDMIWSNMGCLYVFKCADNQEKYQILVQSY
jgi:hypothetical protein